MKIKKSSFVTSAVKVSQCPEDGLPEIAFVGRSNVGKSSLINMLLNRKGLAKTSSTPGKTQLINFFDIDGLFRFVDLPGYGYAKVSKAHKATWGKMIEDYLRNRPNLIDVFLLVDLRHKPTQEDIQMYTWIKEFGFNGVVLGTKADKLTNNQLFKNISMIRKALGMEPDGVLVPVSSSSRAGKYDVWEVMHELLHVNGYDHINIERQSKK